MLGQFSPAVSPTPPWSPAHQLQPFRFRSRTEPIDWRRLSALDVDRVVQEIDVRVLQDFIMTVTFCAADCERCPNCRGPADPSLIKLLRMSQLSTEYLLHCQDFLSTQLSGLEERLQGALSLVQRGEEQRAELEKNLQEAKLENRRRKKLISTQQLLLQASANNYHKVDFLKSCTHKELSRSLFKMVHSHSVQIKSLWSVRFFCYFERSLFAHQGCVYLISNTAIFFK